MKNIENAVDGKAIVTLENNRMKAFLQITAPTGEGQPCSLKDAREALTNCRVVFGIDEVMLKAAIKEHNWGKTLLVASGKEAQNGEDARIIVRFDTQGGTPQVDEDANVNYKNLDLIKNVRAGELLAEKIPPTEGRAGLDVCGQELAPRKGKDARLIAGKNTALDPSKCYLFAQADGHASLFNNRIQVNPVFEIRGNVDYASGDINFIGTVRISGNVMAGFQVHAEGDIEVGGSVEGAVVIAGGNVVVKGGITGGTKGFVRAEGSITARFVENAQLEAGLSVLVKEAIIQSRIKAGSTVSVVGKRAIIVGGLIQAGHEVESKTLGSQLATRTVIEVGVNPHYREEYRQLSRSLAEKKRALENINHSLHTYQRFRQTPEEPTHKQKQALMKLLDLHKALDKEIETAQERIKFLEGEFEGYQAARVKAHEIAYPGVRIGIGKQIYTVNDAIKYSAFALDQGEIRVAAL